MVKVGNVTESIQTFLLTAPTKDMGLCRTMMMKTPV